MNFKYSREFLIGLCVIATVAILYFGIHYLKGVKVMTPSNLYFVKFENVNGLLESSKIMSRGVAVGNVHSIDYNYKDPNAPVVVRLNCDNQLVLPKGTKALLAGILFFVKISFSVIVSFSMLIFIGSSFE